MIIFIEIMKGIDCEILMYMMDVDIEYIYIFVYKYYEEYLDM